MAKILIEYEVDDAKLAELIGSQAASALGGTPVEQPPPWNDAPAQNAPQPAPQAPQAPSGNDPWAQGQPAQQRPVQAPSAPQYQQQYQPAPPQQPQQQQAPVCQHGQRRYVAAGVSQKTGRPYPAFWGCAAPANDPTKCKSIPA